MGKLIEAVKKNDFKAVKALLEDGVLFKSNYRNKPLINQEFQEEEGRVVEMGDTALHVAARFEHINILYLLLNSRADVNQLQYRDDGCSPLIVAVRRKKVKAINILLEKGAKVDLPDKRGFTPLQNAFNVLLERKYFDSEEAEVVQLLVKAKADVNQPTKDESTLLHLALQSNESSFPVSLLLQAGAKVEQPDKDGRTPFYIAAKNGNMSHMLALLEGGAKLVDYDLNLLCFVAENPSIPLIQALLKAGANPNQADKQGHTPLYIVAKNHQNYKNYEKQHRVTGPMLALLQGGAKILDEGRLLLDVALKCDDVKLMQALLQAGAKVNHPDENGITPLLAAARNRDLNPQFIEILLKAGAKVDQYDQEGRTALHMIIQTASGLYWDRNMQTLLKNGAKIDQPDKDGRTALHFAAVEGNLRVVDLLLQARANVEQVDKNGLTPLYLAIRYGHANVIKLLEERVEQQKKSTVPQNRFLPQDSAPVKSDVSSNQFAVLKISFNISHDELILGKELGRGGFGVVYQGTWQKHTDVAIKQLHVARFSDETLAEFKNEMEVMAQIRSPNIIQLYGICTKPYCMVMEYMPNGSLYHVLHSKIDLPWSTREPIALDISKGLSYLHHQNILHRDLKSLNVLLDDHMKAKLCDFGLAKVKTESSSQSNNGAAGTLLWMAPELFQRRAVCTKETDVYSLGMTLWELASREIPFKDASNQAIARSWIEKGEREDIPKDTPPQIAKAITFCWSQEASNRPTCDQVVESLGNVDNNIPQSQPKYISNTYS